MSSEYIACPHCGSPTSSSVKNCNLCSQNLEYSAVGLLNVEERKAYIKRYINDEIEDCDVMKFIEKHAKCHREAPESAYLQLNSPTNDATRGLVQRVEIHYFQILHWVKTGEILAFDEDRIKLQTSAGSFFVISVLVVGIFLLLSVTFFNDLFLSRWTSDADLAFITSVGAGLGITVVIISLIAHAFKASVLESPTYKSLVEYLNGPTKQQCPFCCEEIEVETDMRLCPFCYEPLN